MEKETRSPESDADEDGPDVAGVPGTSPGSVSVGALIRRFWKIALPTWFFVVLEGMAFVAMPMVIGWAVDGLLNGVYDGVFQLAGLSAFLLFVGAGRRFYDTRAYGKIYQKVAAESVEREWEKRSPLTKTSARTNLLAEFIEFLEESIPEVLQQVISVVGTLVIILSIDRTVFLACLGAVVITALVYQISGQKIYRLNRGQNDEFERQIDAISSVDREQLRTHLSRFTKWRIRLSDLETLNFSVVWIILGSLLIYTIVAVSTGGNSTFGQIIAAVMYVFGFIEAVMAFPFYYQQLVRLKEIASRLDGKGSDEKMSSS